MVIVHSALHALSEYSNLLLVILTIVYVLVTWKTLAALKQASLREREAHHLSDIKENVVAPLVRWLDEVRAKLTGGRSIISVFEVSSPKIAPQLGEDPYERKREVRGSPVEFFGLSEALFSDAKNNHFTHELSEFEHLRDRFRQFASDCATFAKERIAEVTSTTKNPGGHIATNPDLLIIECICSQMQNLRIPALDFRQTAPGGREVYGYIDRTNHIARGDVQEVDPWLNRSIELVRNRWISDGLAETAAELLAMICEVQEMLDRIMFTHSLVHDCAFVGSAKTRWRSRQKK